MAESFIQWVIEDRFCRRPPGLGEGRRGDGGLGRSVRRSEDPPAQRHAQLHRLGPARWPASRTSTKARTTPRSAGLAFDYVTDDTIPCLHSREQSPSPIDLAAYRDTVLEPLPATRPSATPTSAWRWDGFSKIPGFIVPTIRTRGCRAVSRSPAWPCCPRCSSPICSVGTCGQIRLHVSRPGDGPGARPTRSARRPTRWWRLPRTRYCSGSSLATRTPGGRGAQCERSAWPTSCAAAAPETAIEATNPTPAERSSHAPAAHPRPRNWNTTSFAHPALGYEPAGQLRLRALPRARLPEPAGALALPRRVRTAPHRAHARQGVRGRLHRPLRTRPPGADRARACRTTGSRPTWRPRAWRCATGCCSSPTRRCAKRQI